MFLNILNDWGLSGPPDFRQESMKQRYLVSPFRGRDPQPVCPDTMFSSATAFQEGLLSRRW